MICRCAHQVPKHGMRWRLVHADRPLLSRLFSPPIPCLPLPKQQHTEMQPFSVAMKQLQAAVTDAQLPPDALASNKKAWHTLTQFAKALESEHSYPPAAVKNVQFVFRDPFAGFRLQRVRCQLKTTGGNCAQLVQQSLGQLLLRLGLNPYFYFDGDQFLLRSPPRPRVLPKPRQAAAGAAA